MSNIQFWQVSNLQNFFDDTVVGQSTSGSVGAAYKEHDALFVTPDPGAAYTVDFSSYSNIWIELTEACTITVDGLTGQKFSPMSIRTVKLWINTQTFAVTWGAGLTWIGGAPTLANNTTSILEFTSPDNGTTIYGRAIADGLTEITAPLRDTRMGYAFGNYSGNWKYRQITMIDTVNELVMQHQTGMMIGADRSLGATSDMIASGWISTGAQLDRGLEYFSLPTGTVLHVNRLLGNYGDYNGAPNACYGENGGSNSKVWFSPGVDSSGNNRTDASTFNMVSYATTNHSLSAYFQNASVMSDDTRGWFVNSSHTTYQAAKSEVIFATDTVNYTASYSVSWDPYAIGNDQTTNGYVVGGKDPVEQFGHDDIKRFTLATGVTATQLSGVLPGALDEGAAQANTLTHLYVGCYATSESSNIKFDWATETVVSGTPTGRMFSTALGGAVLNEFTRN